MKIELKNIKHMESLSEETHCFSATLHVDGHKIGEISNHGHGGPDAFHGDQATYDKADAWVAANMDPLEIADTDPLPMDLEIYCGQLLEDHLIRVDLRKTLRNRVLIKHPDRDGIYAMRWKGVRKIESRHIADIRQTYPDAIILNSLPLEDALALYRQAA